MYLINYKMNDVQNYSRACENSFVSKTKEKYSLEILNNLKQAGVRDSNIWINTLKYATFSQNTTIELHQSVMNLLGSKKKILIDDSNIPVYMFLLSHLQPKEVVLHIRSDPNKLEPLKQLFKCLSEIKSDISITLDNRTDRLTPLRVELDMALQKVFQW